MRLVKPQRLHWLGALEAMAHLLSEARFRNGEPQKRRGSAEQTKLAMQ